MTIGNLAGPHSIGGELPRSTAYYYGDLERIKRKQNGGPDETQNPDELSEYVESNEVFNEAPICEIPPFRDRPLRQFSLPEYSTPEGPRKPGETYSTAGTFPMPKEKEPLLAELEIVGRLPLTELDSCSGVRRSRSWYLCCPNMGEDEISRESSWRYSSLRPVTAPPLPGQNGMGFVVATSTSHDDVPALRAERDALARALASERQRAANAARAHDARLAELHGVIAELMRRRAADKHTSAIPEEEHTDRSDECESTTQPAGELDNDADRSRTDQNDTSSALSPELPTPQESKAQQLPDDSETDVSAQEIHIRVDKVADCDAAQELHEIADNYETSLNLSERDSEICLSTARCCQLSRHGHSAVGSSCERELGSLGDRSPLKHAASPARSESRQAKLASRVRLRRTEDCITTTQLSSDEAWCAEAAERLALDVCAQADLREALVAANSDATAIQAALAASKARSARLEADSRVLECALARATDTAHRLATACAVHESSTVGLCLSLRAADRALETYDVLLALAETNANSHEERSAAELVAKRLLSQLDTECAGATIGEPLLSPGPWLLHNTQAHIEPEWTADCEERLRRHAARLKSETASLRAHQPPPQLFTYHDIEEDDLPKSVCAVNMAEMESAVLMQEVLTAREERAAAISALVTERARLAAVLRTLGQAGDALPTVPVIDDSTSTRKSSSSRSRRRAERDKERHWLEPHTASETDL